MQIQQIVNSKLNSNTFVLLEENSLYCWLIDIGDVEPILKIIGNRFVKGVFLTHTHYDHIYGINTLVKRFPKCVIYTSRYGKEGLFSSILNLSRYHKDPIEFKGKHVYILDEDDEVLLFPNVKLKSMYTPGHDWSCMSYYTSEVVFTGDSYIPNAKIVTTFPKSNKLDATISHCRILELVKSRDIYPGHFDCKFR